MTALQQARTVVHEPVHSFVLKAPAQALGPVLPALARLGAVPRTQAVQGASCVLADDHDAFGKILGRNSFDLLGPEWVNADLAAYLDERFAGEYLDRYTLRRPRPTMPLYHLVGALDPLERRRPRQSPSATACRKHWPSGSPPTDSRI